MLQRALSEYLTRADQVQQLVLLRTGPGRRRFLGRRHRRRAPARGGRHAGRRRYDSGDRPRRAQAKALVKRFEAIAAGSTGAARGA
jgi:hypothetical protein